MKSMKDIRHNKKISKSRIKLDSLRNQGKLKESQTPDLTELLYTKKTSRGHVDRKWDSALLVVKSLVGRLLSAVRSTLKLISDNVSSASIGQVRKTISKQGFSARAVFESILKLKSNHVLYKRKYIAGFILFSLVSVFIVVSLSGDRSAISPTTGTLGATSQEAAQGPVEISLQSIDYPIYLPASLLSNAQSVAKVNPPNSATAYAYVDIQDGINIKVTQQELPADFKEASDRKLKELADSFQAFNVIQLNGNKIYHGLSEKTKVQSIVFIKGDLLIFIAAANKLSDESWVGYIDGLILTDQ